MGARGRPRKRGRSWSGHNGPRPDTRESRGGRAQVPQLQELTPFSVLCARYLGITETDGYARQDLATVARRLGSTPEELQRFLEENRLRRQDLREANFNLTSAQLDIRVAPAGISRTELARTLFAELEQDSKNGDPPAAGPPGAEVPAGETSDV